MTTDDNFPRAPDAVKVGLHSGLGFPIRHGARVLGVMEFFSEEIQRPDADLLQMLTAIGQQIGQFIERQRMETALRDSEALYNSLVDTLPINVLRKDLAGKVTFGNKPYCETLGRPLQDLLHKTDFDLFPRELAQKYVADDRKVIETRQVFEDIEQQRKPDGTGRESYGREFEETGARGRNNRGKTGYALPQSQRCSDNAINLTI